MAIKNYKYDYEDNEFTINLDTGGFVSVHMELEILDLNRIGYEYDFSDDHLKDAYFKINGQFYSGLQLVQWAQENLENERAIAEEEGAYEAKMAAELSSPYWTGRI